MLAKTSRVNYRLSEESLNPNLRQRGSMRIFERLRRAARLSRPHLLVQVQPSRSISSEFANQVQYLAARALAGDFRGAPVREHASGAFGGGSTKVLLLHPPGACSAFTRSGSQYPPLGLSQLKAVIGNPSVVDVLEADGFGYSVDETIEKVRDTMPIAVGMTVTCGTKPLVHAWSTVVKNLSAARHQNPIVIVGGPAAAFESQSIFDECPNVDVVVKGEGEVTFPSIVAILTDPDLHTNADRLALLSELPGVCVRNMPAMNDCKIPTLPKEAFDTLPFPDLSASPVSKYCAPDALRSPMVTMMTQRGCIAKCAFCNTPQIHGTKIRRWSSERVVEELVRLKRLHGIRELSFVDDVFTNRPGGGARKLCELMIQADLDLTWYCNVRADQVTPRIASKMKQDGSTKASAWRTLSAAPRPSKPPTSESRSGSSRGCREKRTTRSASQSICATAYGRTGSSSRDSRRFPARSSPRACIPKLAP
jgi:B12 binding domain